ncbi:hypothetical protein JCM11491_007020 [Sporobolomyces phaffii]
MRQLYVAEGTELSADALEALMGVAVSISECAHLVVQTGAGVSTNAGIPDFRSSSSGIYAAASRPVSTRHMTGSTRSAKDMFSYASIVDSATRPAHLRYMANLHAQCRRASSTVFHRLLKRLNAIDRLLRVYSQNVDGFERDAGLEFVDLERSDARRHLGTAPISHDDAEADSASDYEESARRRPPRKRTRISRSLVETERWAGLPSSQKVVAMHGSLRNVVCSTCGWKVNWSDEIQMAFEKGKRVECPRCDARSELRLSASKRRLPPSSLSFLRPNLLLYDDPSSSSSSHLSLLSSLSSFDLSSNPDFLLVAGTSLQIPGFKQLVKSFAREVRANGGICVLVNREPVASAWDHVFDLEFRMDADLFAETLLANLAAVCPSMAHSSSATTSPPTPFSTFGCISPTSIPTPDLRQTPSPARRMASEPTRIVSHLPTPSPTPSLSGSTRLEPPPHFEPVAAFPFASAVPSSVDTSPLAATAKLEPQVLPSPPPTSSPLRLRSDPHPRLLEGSPCNSEPYASDDADQEDGLLEDDSSDDPASEAEEEQEEGANEADRVWTAKESRSLVDELMREAQEFWQQGG